MKLKDTKAVVAVPSTIYVGFELYEEHHPRPLSILLLEFLG